MFSTNGVVSEVEIMAVQMAISNQPPKAFSEHVNRSKSERFNDHYTGLKFKSIDLQQKSANVVTKPQATWEMSGENISSDYATKIRSEKLKWE